MGRWSSGWAMIALAAVLCAPVIIAAESSLTDPAPRSNATVLSAGVTGFQRRVPEIVGASVYNVQNERIGGIADIRAGRSPDVVLSLGGFHGITGKLVEVPTGLIEVQNDKLVIASATKDQLMQLPAYRYGTRS